MFQNRLDHIQLQRNYAIFIAPEETQVAKIKVIGVGGGGCNAVSSMISQGLNGVEFIAVNTDVQSLNSCLASNKIQIGAAITKGLGTGGNVELGRKAAEEDREKILKAIEGAEMVFIATGLGGGTGTGSSPVVANVAKSTGALVVAVATKPHSEEGPQRKKIAEKGLIELREVCDSIIVIPNDNIELALDKNASVQEGYDKPNEVLFNAVKGISDVILRSGKVNVDFADVKTVLRDSGEALMGIGRASGENKVIEALNKAISSPLLEEIDLRNAHSLLVNFTGSSSMKYFEVRDAMRRINEMINQNAFIKFGIVTDENLGDEVLVTVIATGYSRIPRYNAPEETSSELKLIKEDVNSSNLIQDSDESTIQINFNNVKYDPEKDNEYMIPTYLRLKGAKKGNDKIAGNESELNNKDANSLFKNLNKKDDEDDQDTSAFLRKLMD